LAQLTRVEIEKEADDHIALGLLLRKNRSDPKRDAVQQVLASELTVTQKIEKIREIDEKEDVSGVLHIVRQATAQVARNKVSRINRTIKRPLERIPFLAFLFGEFGKVREFGRRSHVLEVRLLPPGIRLDRHLVDFLTNEVKGSAKELSLRLKPVVEHGWLYLTPRQYNLIVLLKRLSDRIQTFDFLRLNIRDSNLIDRLKRIESLFLMLHYSPDTTETIIEAVRTFGEKRHEEREETVRTNSLVLEVLAEDFALPSLYNCLLGLNVFRYRRFLTLPELMREGLGDMVDGTSFDCESSVRTRIDQYVENALQSMRKLHEQLLETRHLNSFIVFNEERKLDTTLLSRLYRSADSREPPDFQADQDNLVLFASRLIHGFDLVFSSLLNGQCVLGEGRRTAVFSPAFFEKDFTKLRTLEEKLEQGPFHFSSFPLDRYLQIRDDRLGTIGTEMEVSQLIEESVGCLVDLGKALMKILGARPPQGTPGDTQEPLEPTILQGKPFVLPPGNLRTQARSLLNGKTVSEALIMAVTVCFSAGILLQDDFLFRFLRSETKLQAELRAQLRLVETLLDPESYRELSRLYA
jgi:hypothetical protein